MRLSTGMVLVTTFATEYEFYCLFSLECVPLICFFCFDGVG